MIPDNYECDGQMSLEDYIESQLDYTVDRYGHKSEARPWMHRERCENCVYWYMIPTADQPPAGWGVMGQCDLLREGQKGYEIVSKTSYCQEFKCKYLQKKQKQAKTEKADGNNSSQ